MEWQDARVEILRAKGALRMATCLLGWGLTVIRCFGFGGAKAAASRRTPKSAGELVVHHEAEEDGNVQHGGVHEPLGAGVGLGAGSPEANLDKAGAGDESAKEIEDSGKAHDRGEQADGDKRGSIKNDLAEGARAVFVDNGKHEDAGAGVVFTIHPGNGVEVGELPVKEDGEE